jgi:hypothetical protein
MVAQSVSPPRTFSKPQEARELEARARAKRLGVRVAAVVHGSRYVTASQSAPGVVYVQQRTPAGWACSCDGFMFTGCCKHLGQVERRCERDGIDFGAIAPLHRASKYFPLDLPENVAVQGAVLTVGAEAPALAANITPIRRPLTAIERTIVAQELYG